MAKRAKKDRAKGKLARRAGRDLILAGLGRRAFASRNERRYTRKVKHPKQEKD